MLFRSLINLTDQIFCIPVSGASDYEYHVENTALGYDKYAIRNSVATDFRLSWIASSVNMGLRFATTYDVSVEQKWVEFG